MVYGKSVNNDVLIYVFLSKVSNQSGMVLIWSDDAIKRTIASSYSFLCSPEFRISFGAKTTLRNCIREEGFCSNTALVRTYVVGGNIMD